MRPAPAVLLLVLALSATACGARSSSAEKAGAEGTSTGITVVVGDALGSWGVDMSGPEVTTRHVPVAKQLSVLARPRSPSDSFDNWYSQRPSDSAEGDDKPSDGRLLLSHLGTENLMLFAVPTDRGWVCPYLVYDDGELAVADSCVNGLVEGFGLQMSGEGTLYRIYGVVGDEIQRVSVAAGERRFPARVGENGFYFETKTTLICPLDIDYLLVEQQNGSDVKVDFNHLAPALKGTTRESYGCV